MVAIMRDAIGVGLAATQLGVMHRLLVFQAGLDATPTAVVNPELEWLSDELAIAEEGCLSLPGVDGRRRAPAARAGPRPRRPRRAAPGRGLGPRGARPPARDRPPRRRADPRPHRARAAQGRRCGRCARATSYSPPATTTTQPRRTRLRGSLKVVYLGTSGFAVRGAAPARRLAAPPGPRGHAARPPPGAGPQAGAPARSPRPPASSASSCTRRPR